MSPLALPWVAETDYEGFKILLADLPITYCEWLATHRRTVAFVQARGGAFVVNVDLQQFTLFVRGKEASSEAGLWEYAMAMTQLRPFSRPKW